MSARLLSCCAAALLAATIGCSRREPDRYDWVMSHHDAGEFSARVDLSDPTTSWQRLSGFWPVTDRAWAWTEPTFALLLGAPRTPPRRPVLKLLGYVPPPEIARLGSVTLRANAGGVALAPQTITASGGFTYERALSADALARPLRVEFAVEKAFVPGNPDTRSLGIVVNAIWIDDP